MKEGLMKPTMKQLEALRELINIGVGKGASILNTMLNSHIKLQVPSLKLISVSDLNKEFEKLGAGKLSAIALKFDGPFSGSADLLFPSETALALVNALVGDSPEEMDFDSIRVGTLCEVGNVVLNGVMGSISNLFKTYFEYSVPEYIEETAGNIFSMNLSSEGMTILLAKTRFVIEELDIDGDIILFFEVGAFDKLIHMIEEL